MHCTYAHPPPPHTHCPLHRALDGVTKGFMDFTNTKSFLCMSGHMSWGARMQLLNYTAYDIVRGATMFGSVSIYVLPLGRDRNLVPGYLTARAWGTVCAGPCL